MKLNLQTLKNREAWTRVGFVLPSFDIEKMRAVTRTNPAWVHFGAGNIFRAFPAERLQQLLDKGIEKTGIVAVDGFDYQIIEAAYRPYDNLCVSVVLKGDGGVDKTVVASIAESLMADCSSPDYNRLKIIFRSASLQMASFTISEKGYSLEREGRLSSSAMADFANGPSAPNHFMGRVAALLHERYLAGAKPVTLVSLDNCSHNGDVLRKSVMAFATKWVENGKADKGFLAYVESPKTVSFPWSMIDKITPRPEEGVKRMLEAAGLEDMKITVTDKHNYVAPFVNAEDAAYLVIEDAFPNGRPALEKAGVIFTDRATVDKAEKMKVCTCLNPLHTAMGIFSVMLGFTSVSEVMKDPDLLGLVERIGYDEGYKVVVDPKVINPMDFIKEVLEKRFPNPHVPDTPQRLCVDMSQGIPIRFGETVKAYMAREDLDVKNLVFIPLTFAGWCRYLMAVDDNGAPFELSPDPMLEEVRPHLAGIALGDKGPFHNALQPILSNARIFGVDLYQAGLGERVEGYFVELVSGKGGVRGTLRKYLGR